MIAKNNESMASFTFSLKQLTEDEKIQMQCEAREMYECDKASFILQGIEQERQNTLREKQRALREKQNALREKQRADAMQIEKEALEEELRQLKAELGK